MAVPEKMYLDIDVLEAAKTRISRVFDDFEKVIVSFSAGKDSTVMLHLVAEEARKRNRKFALLFIDWEAQFNHTISHCQAMYDLYADCTDPYWITLPLITTNACSMYEPEWICWEHGKEEIWVRERPPISIKDESTLPFYYYPMSFEEFVPEFTAWYAEGKPCASFVGIRTAESLNRWRSIFNGNKGRWQDLHWSTRVIAECYNFYPIYDWEVKDIWHYHATTQTPYNPLYDLMLQAGLKPHQMRICEPYGDEQRQGLWLYHVVEPETWHRVVGRVAGANTGALYASDSSGILGDKKIVKPEGLTWKQYALMLLESMPIRTSEHYKNKVAVWLRWYQKNGWVPPPDGRHGNNSLEVGSLEVFDSLPSDTGSKDIPSWRRVCKMLLKNDFWCRTLSFSVNNKQDGYEKYVTRMKKNRKNWGIFDEIPDAK